MLGTLGFSNKFKHIVALTNETQTMFSFPKIFKFNSVTYYPTTGKKKKKKSHRYLCVKY